MNIIQQDFDRLAAFETERWSHNSHYHPYLLKHVPLACQTSLEIGCGAGSFSRLLAQRSKHVLALDLSPEMIRVAKERSEKYPNIEYRVGDVLEMDLGQESFDCIVSIATLHHLPLERMLEKMKSALRAGGVLLVLDLYQGKGIRDPMNWVAAPLNVVLKLVKTGCLQEPAEARAAWAEHGKHDRYLPMSQVRRICAETIPGAVVKKHLLWRVSLVWRKF